jgi:hypothetical protein
VAGGPLGRWRLHVLRRVLACSSGEPYIHHANVPLSRSVRLEPVLAYKCGLFIGQPLRFVYYLLFLC